MPSKRDTFAAAVVFICIAAGALTFLWHAPLWVWLTALAMLILCGVWLAMAVSVIVKESH